jgi:Bacterial SH3 domain
MSVVRIAAAAAAFSLLSAVGATAKPVTLTTETNLRKAPGTDSEVLTLIPKGTTVEVGKCTNGWCEATLDDKKGFAIAQNLGMARRPPPRGPAGGEEIVEEEGPPVYGPRYVAGPPVYYRPYYGYGYGYGPYYGYGWGYRGWGWRW